MSTPGTLWNSADVARAYREVRGVTESVRRTWRAAFRAALPDLRPRRSLDLGCGTGRFTALIAETFGGAVIGVDASVTMLEERPAAGAQPLTFAAAQADALPLRDAVIDLALLSMVYHLLPARDCVVTELRRVAAPDGIVLVRTPTRELMDRVSFLPFFPGARAIDEARMPSRASLVDVFTAAGFERLTHATVEQEFAASPSEAFEKVRRRPFSTLRMISDAAFAEGLTLYEAFCRSLPTEPLVEPLDLFVFRRR
ncbi:MAG TPA: methyltransferase domain-containing protein [Methylomirabilota bacterium]|nr:methyltransferase domain-containing protein [Methylomirabilota bacterium]